MAGPAPVGGVAVEGAREEGMGGRGVVRHHQQVALHSPAEVGDGAREGARVVGAARETSGLKAHLTAWKREETARSQRRER